MNDPTLGLYVICRDAEETIQALLDSVLKPKPVFDAYSFFDTGSTDKTREIISVAFNWEKDSLWDRSRAVIGIAGESIQFACGNFVWQGDFSIARNDAFRCGWKTDWRMFLDSDDVIENAQYLRSGIAAITKDNPQVNAIALPYHYPPTEMRPRIFRWADGFSWKGAIHEQCTCPNQRTVEIDDIQVFHNRSHAGMIRSLERNMNICRGIYDKDPAQKAQMAFYLGTYAKTLAIEKGDDGLLDQAATFLDEAQKAFPAAPAGVYALVDLAQVCLARKQFSMANAHADEAFRRAPDSPEAKGVLSLVRSNSKRVSIYCPDAPKPFGPFSHTLGHVGGSEEAVIHLAPALARLGYGVTVYVKRPETGAASYADGVFWKDETEFDPQGDHSNVLFWRSPKTMLDPRVRDGKYRKLLWLHDTCYFYEAIKDHGDIAVKAARAAYSSADSVICLSQAHAKAIANWDGYEGPNVVIASNGIDITAFPELRAHEPRDERSVIYCAAPDRGLEHLAALWPDVTAAVSASLHVYYDWAAFRARYPERAANLANKLEALPGVFLHGGVSHIELHKAMRRASIYAYPQESSTLETSCISAMKAVASGLWPVVTDQGALSETLGGRVLDPGDIRTDAGRRLFAHALIEALSHPPSFEARRVASDVARDRFDWNKVAVRFSEIIGGAK